MLVAVFMLFVVGGMAALSIDAVTIYTARSEAQLAADGAALAAARMLANSGVTSDTTGGLMTAAEPLAQAVAIQVAQNNLVGGRYLVATNGEVAVTFSVTPTNNPKVTVRTQRTDLPTFFARIWGSTQITVAASATAEAYNPSGAVATSGSSAPPVAPICVKPWLLPNLDPTTSSSIFGTDGSITNSNLLGWSSGTPMTFACGPSGNCLTGSLPTPVAWNYYPGDQSSFPAPPPTAGSPTCNPALTNPYQESIAGCVQLPISCHSSTTNPANIDLTTYTGSRSSDTADAVNCLTHSTIGGNDTIAVPAPPSAPFQFVVGADNPVALAYPGLILSNVMVSDSLVTVPVFDQTTFTPSSTSVPIIGFVQLFLNPTPLAVTSANINTTIVNMVGCGTNVSGPPILGNGASPVAVRLISPSP